MDYEYKNGYAHENLFKSCHERTLNIYDNKIFLLLLLLIDCSLNLA
jgi:hypothetical protein